MTLSRYKTLVRGLISKDTRSFPKGVLPPELLCICQRIAERYQCFEGSVLRVLKVLYCGVKLKRCVVCGERLSFRKSANEKKNFLYCSEYCRKKDAESFFKRRKEAFVEKYGVDNPSKLASVKEKKRERALSRFGVDNVAKSSAVQQKIEETNLLRYGTRRASSSDVVREKIKSSLRASDKIETGKRISEKLLDLERTKERLEAFGLDFVDENYYGQNKFYHSGLIGDGYLLRCRACGCRFRHLLRWEEKPEQWCPTCFPKTRSSAEDSFVSVVRGCVPEAVLNTRTVIPPFELDVYVPDKGIAFEFDGLFWHSERLGKDRGYHLDKTKRCAEAGVRLVHVFEDEWMFKRDIVVSRVRHLLGCQTRRIFARKCEVREVSDKHARDFLEATHIQGYCASKVRIGLFNDDELVALMTFGKPRFSRTYDWELLRFSCSLNTAVVGGAGRLLAYFKREHVGSIVSYADRRWSDGGLYKALGFDCVGESAPCCWYVKGCTRVSRYSCRKKSLKAWLECYDDALSQRENMMNNGFSRIWDCGTLVFAK